MNLTIDHPSAGAIRQTGIPIKFSATPGAIDAPPPLLGGHSAEILAQLGYDEGQVRELKERGVI